jgi:hypothetical protein
VTRRTHEAIEEMIQSLRDASRKMREIADIGDQIADIHAAALADGRGQLDHTPAERASLEALDVKRRAIRLAP